MKTYLFNAINKYKKFSETLEVKKAICDKAWWVFNDSGEKELYIFQEDGTLYITLSGKVNNGTWQYIPANKSIIITANNQSYMVHAAFMDDCLFAMQVDGTEQYAFLIDEQNKQNFLPETYSDVINYFIAKEQKTLEKERRQQLLILQQEKEEKERLANEQERQRKMELSYRAMDIGGRRGGCIDSLLLIIICIIPGTIFFWLYIFYIGSLFMSLARWMDSGTVGILLLLLLFIGGLFAILFPIVFQLSKFYESIWSFIKRKNCEKWKKEHPDDPVNEFLD